MKKLVVARINGDNHTSVLEVIYDTDSLMYDAQIIKYKLDKLFNIPVYLHKSESE